MTRPQLEAVAVGASAGALEALSVVLPALPPDFPLPILVVVHLPPDRKSLMAGLLGDRCRLSVREAEDKEPAEPGTVYLAPPDYHLMVEPDRRLSLSGEEPVLFSRPSIDVLFETAAETYGPGLAGVILSGANSDGARGLRAIMNAGGVGMVQRPDTALAQTMPTSALAACPKALALDLAEIAAALRDMVESR
ncbi:chemotaxis protein CheB [Paludisphaera rhizosphaerae]|uniref:chemotaxis protein CheB n=1 Tax=Paludisphaera rhizosphaerae TaxID=2711216 RepID=UPI0013E9B759|nr:chemotaxis protein CheB [Paludisphaera rhizosphaerae]